MFNIVFPYIKFGDIEYFIEEEDDEGIELFPDALTQIELIIKEKDGIYKIGTDSHHGYTFRHLIKTLCNKHKSLPTEAIFFLPDIPSQIYLESNVETGIISIEYQWRVLGFWEALANSDTGRDYSAREEFMTVEELIVWAEKNGARIYL